MIAKREFVIGSVAALSLLGCAAPARQSTSARIERIPLPDGRTLEVFIGGAPGGFPLVAHHGTPSDATTYSDWQAICERQGFLLICASRPGYAGSSRMPGRTVADAAKDTAAMLDKLGHRRFATLGWSGGGPHALACAALLPQRCAAVATLASVGPYGAQGLDFLAGMGPENVDEFGAAIAGEAALRRWMDQNGPALQNVTGEQIAAALGGLVPDVDKAALTGGFADHAAAVMRRALAGGFDGWIDDDLAFTRPWGFDLSAIRQPTAIWQGELDLMVPPAHGRWLASRLPGAARRIVPGEGHLSLGAGPKREEIVALLRQQVAR
jgi:pimeloyl-ACP methyl ester carboxylesterase